MAPVASQSARARFSVYPFIRFESRPHASGLPDADGPLENEKVLIYNI